MKALFSECLPPDGDRLGTQHTPVLRELSKYTQLGTPSLTDHPTPLHPVKHEVTVDRRPGKLVCKKKSIA